MQHLSVRQRLGHDPLGIHGGADAPNAPRPVNPADFFVARLLNGKYFVSAQQLNQKVIQKVRARSHQDVLRVDFHPPKSGQVGGDGLTQLQDALVGQGQQQLPPIIQNHFPLKLAPHRKGEMPGAVGGEIQYGCFLRHGFGGHRRKCRGQLLHFFHKKAHLLPGANVALGQKLGVGSFHRDFPNLQMLGKRPLGGQLLTGLQLAGENILPDAAIQRFVQGHTRLLFQLIGQHGLLPLP